MSATTKLNIGKIPISKGEYQDGTTYQRLNQVTMLGSTYQSKIDDNTSAPAQIGADGAVENINTDKWLCVAVGNVSAAKKVVYNNETSGLEAGNVQEAIDETNTKLGYTNASVKGTKLNNDYNNKIDIIIKNGQSFTLHINGAEGILKDNLIGSVFAISSSNKRIDLTNTVSCINYNKSFVATDDLKSIEIARGASGILTEGDITLKVSSVPFYTKEEIDNQSQNEQTKVNTELLDKIDKSSIVQELGESEDKVASQKLIKKVSDKVPYDLGNILTNKLETVIGEDYNNIINIPIIEGEQFSVIIKATDGLLKDNLLGTLFGVDATKNTRVVLKNLVNAIDFIGDFIASGNFKGIGIARGGTGVIDTGVIELSVSKAPFYTKEELGNKLKEELSDKINKEDISQSINDSKDKVTSEYAVRNYVFNEVGSCISSTVQAIKDAPYINKIDVNIQKGDTFTINVKGESGILSGDLIGSLWAYYNNKEFDSLSSSFNYTDFSQTFKAEKDYTAIEIRRSVAIKDGNITLTIDNRKFALKDELNNETEKLRNDINVLQKFNSTMYVSTEGSDDNDGSLSKPLLTVNKALELGASTIFILPGLYYQQIDISKAKSRIYISNNDSHEKVIFKPKDYILAKEEQKTDGYTKVYKSTPASFFTFTDANIFLFQENIKSKLIQEEERLPQQRGQQYRLDNTVIKKCSSNTLHEALQEIDVSDDYKWFYDKDDMILYFSRPQVVSETNPITCSKGDSLFSGISHMSVLEISNIETWYLQFNLRNINKAIVTDCAAKYVYGGGAFSWMNGTNVKFERCEAAVAYSGTVGDGFNGHADKTGDAFAKTCVATLIDCWAHDNNDDGYSDHERAEMNIYGGLYEYNGKAGITPSYGSHCVCHNVYSRNNYSGFFYTGNTASDEGGANGQLLCYNCVADGNKGRGGYETGFRVGGNGNSMKLVNCKSINNKIGYACDSASKIELIDCGAYNNSIDKKDDTGSWSYINTVSMQA